MSINNNYNTRVVNVDKIISEPVWKHLRLYHKNTQITTDYMRILYPRTALHDTLRTFAGIQFTLSLTAEGNEKPEQ